MKLRFAFGTVTYGRRIPDLAAMLDDIADAGYEGVEICQAPDMIAGIRTHAALEKMAADRGLQVLGYVGGTLESRMQFCGAGFSGYLVIDDWDDDACKRAMEAGYRLALHPHVLHEIARVEDAIPYLKAHDRLLLLPDTGHMGINGEDMLGMANNPLCLTRLAALHLKDWEPQFGRHSHRYARGFVDLGKGDLKDKISSLLQHLAANSGREELWTVAEVDSSRVSERASAIACADWLRRESHAIGSAKPARSLPWPLLPESSPTPCPWEPSAEVQFCHEVLAAAGRDAASFYQEITSAFHRLLPCVVTEVRVYTPQLHSLELAGWHGPNDWEPDPHIPVGHGANNLSHRAVLEQRCIRFPLPHDKFQRPERIAKHGLQQMIAVPVVNSWNAHHVRFLINLFPQSPQPESIEVNLERIAHVIARAADLMLDERCLLAAGEMQHERVQYKSSTQFFEYLRDRIRHTLNCEGVAIFTVVHNRERLELAATTKTKWRDDIKPNEQHYKKGEGHTGDVWKRNRLFYKRYDEQDIPTRARSWEVVDSSDRDDCLMAPISRRGGSRPVLGVVRCRNRMRGDHVAPLMFTDDDAAALDALLQTALPQLELLLDQEQRLRSLRRLLHEFHVPNNAVRHCVQRMQRDLTKDGKEPAKFFSQDFLGDIWSYTNLVGAHLQNAALYGGGFQEIKPRFKETILYSEVIAPAVNHVGSLLKAESLSPGAIRYGSFVGFPPLWVDPTQFQQVFFNLLSNAIKYGGGPGRFRVEITAGVQTGKAFHIWFSDHGPGIREEDHERIFDSGWRSENAVDQNIAGHGLGLGIVRDIIKAHDGTIRLVKCQNPTRFQISLPFSLASGRPSVQHPP